MYIEQATITVRPGMENEFEVAAAKAVDVFRNSRGCDGMEVRRSVENPSKYFLFVRWRTMDDHLVHFRNSDSGLQSWRNLVSHCYDGMPTVEHSQTVIEGFVTEQRS